MDIDCYTPTDKRFAINGFLFVGELPAPQKNYRIWTAGQRLRSKVGQKFQWRLYIGGPSNEVEYTNWLPKQPDMRRRRRHREDYVEMLYNAKLNGTASVRWNDQFYYQKNFVLCEFNVM